MLLFGIGLGHWMFDKNWKTGLYLFSDPGHGHGDGHGQSDIRGQKITFAAFQ